MGVSERRSFLDKPAARGCALLVIFLCLAALGYLNRASLFTEAQLSGSASDDPVAACIDERGNDIENMVADRAIDQAQAERFKQRAEAMCWDAQGKGNAAPPLPGLPTK